MIEDIAALLTEPMVVSVLQRTFAIPDELSRTEILACLARRLPSSETIRALADVLRVERDDWRATTLAALVPRLVELDADLQAIALSACVGALSALVRSDRTSLIQALAPFGEGRLLRQLLDAALAPNADTDADLAALAPHLDGAMIQHAFEKVLALEPADRRPAALTALSCSLSGALAEQALDAALQDEDEEDAAPVMAALAARVGEGSRRRFSKHALQFGESSTGPAFRLPGGGHLGREARTKRIRVLTALLQFLSGEDKARAIDAISTELPSVSDGQALYLEKLLPHLDDLKKQQLLEALLVDALQWPWSPDRRTAGLRDREANDEVIARILERPIEGRAWQTLCGQLAARMHNNHLSHCLSTGAAL